MNSRDIGLVMAGDVDSPDTDGDIRIVDSDAEGVEDIKNLFVLASALALPEVSDIIHRANRLKHLRGLLIDQEHDSNWAPTMLDRAGLRTLLNTLVHSDAKVFQRILNAWRLGAEDELIADATVQDGLLLVRTCALDTLEISVDDLRPLRGESGDELANFEVADDGSHLHWPAPGVHLDLQAIRAAIDPELREELRAERLKSDELMGQAIRTLRNEAGLTQKDIPNLSARQVRRIEKGETSPRTKSLRAFADAHGLEMNDYLNRVAEEMRRLRSNLSDG